MFFFPVRVETWPPPDLLCFITHQATNITDSFPLSLSTDGCLSGCLSDSFTRREAQNSFEWSSKNCTINNLWNNGTVRGHTQTQTHYSTHIIFVVVLFVYRYIVNVCDCHCLSVFWHLSCSVFFVDPRKSSCCFCKSKTGIQIQYINKLASSP
jgi:hypothetical protein